MRDVRVRRAKPADIGAIYHVTRRSREAAFSGLLPADALDWDADVTDGFRTFVADIIAHEDEAQLVAVSDGAVVGLAELGWHPAETQDFVGDSEAELKAIHVRPDRWDEGIGTELLTGAVDVLPARLSAIALCVLSENERARSFYERRDFERDGTTTSTVADEDYTEVVYRRQL